MRVVLDTNVIVSSTLSAKGASAQIVGRWTRSGFTPLVSEAILTEYGRALAYPKVRARHGMSDEAIAALVADFRTFALVVDPVETVDVVEDDPADNEFLACAISGGAEYVISGDEHLLRIREYRGVRILSPREFLILPESRPPPGED